MASIPKSIADLPLAQPRYVGKDLPRIEDAALLTGRVDFTDNLAFAGMLHGAVLRSPHPHARIRGIDTSRAEALPGVAGVITGADALAWSEPLPGMPAGWAGHCLATEKVTFAAKPVAGAAAASRYVAEDALDLIEVDYEEL